MKKTWIIAGIVLLYLAGMLVWWFRLPSKSVVVTVPPGASAREVAGVLHKAGVLPSKTVFLVTARLMGRATQLKPGAYLVTPRDSVFRIIEMMSGSKARGCKVTIPEGFTVRQVAETLADGNIVDRERFLQLASERQLEGYLFPQTYFFSPGLPAEVVVDQMIREFHRNFTPEMSERAKELHMSEKEILTLASIIEKEAVRSEERPLIAGVFYNRLKKRWYLESCATVLYALGVHKERLTLEDLRIESPYNTYRHFGLPPGPICNPGMASIKAALYPTSTDDMFFVASSSGSHVFSRYFSEHVRNKKKERSRRK